MWRGLSLYSLWFGFRVQHIQLHDKMTQGIHLHYEDLTRWKAFSALLAMPPSPVALAGGAPPLLRDAVDLLQLLLLVVTERRCQTLVPGGVTVLDSWNARDDVSQITAWGALLFTTTAKDEGGLTQEGRCEEVILVLSVVIVQRGAVLLQGCPFQSVVVPVVLVVVIVILVVTALAGCHARLQLHCTAVLIHLVFIAWDLLCQRVKKLKKQQQIIQ